jgi:hypothetical protein
MHWRGDRSNGFFGTSATSEDLSFRNFIVAFEGLVGRDGPISNGDMQAFTDFQLQVTLPPNPVRNLDNSLTPAQANGRNFYLGNSFLANNATTGVGGTSQSGRRADGINLNNFGFTCNGCHVLDPAQGFFGTDGQASFENEPQIMKIAHLRNIYQKVGMFGMPDVAFNNALNTPHEGDEIRGFGFLHDGSTDTVFRFFQATVFNNANGVGFPSGAAGNGVRRDMEQFMFAFDSDLAPVVGQQVTLTSSNAGVAGPRIDLLQTRANTPFTSQILGAGVNECDLVVKGTIGGVERGWVWRPGALGYQPDDGGPNVNDATLRALANTAGQELTFTCVTPGAGTRAGIDRDRDAVLDGLDVCADVPDPAQADADADGAGDACDNCAARANASQADTDADGSGNECDAQCIGAETTTIASIAPVQGIVGQTLEVFGTGFGPSVQVRVGGIAAATYTLADRLAVTVPPGLADGAHAVVVTNPEGCQSQEAVSFTIIPPGSSSCGLIGIEGFALLGFLGWTRRRARRSNA